MNEVCYSAKDAFEKRFIQVQSASSTKGHEHAIYGTENIKQSVMVNKKGFRPNCSSGLIYESEELEGLTGRDGQFVRREYTLSNVGIAEKMQEATRDELNMFLVLANPNVLNDEENQKAFFDRLTAIQKEENIQSVLGHKSSSELSEKQEEEVEKYNKFFEMNKGAVEDPTIKAFFPAGYELDAVTEYLYE